MDPDSVSIAGLARNCVAAFRRCLLSIPVRHNGPRALQESHSGPGNSPLGSFGPTIEETAQYHWLENRLADFHLWADGVGAIAKYHASLDYRFESDDSELLPVKTLLLLLRSDLEEFNVDAKDDLRLSIDARLKGLAIIGLAIRRTGRGSRLQKYDNKFDSSKHVELQRVLRLVCMRRYAGAFHSTMTVEDKINRLVDAELTPAQDRIIQSNLRRRSRFMSSYHHSKGLRSIQRAIASTHTGQKGMDPNVANSASSNSGPPSGQSPSQRSTLGHSSKLGLGNPTESIPSTMASTPLSQMHIQSLDDTLPSKRPETSITAITGAAKYPKPPELDEYLRLFKCPACFQTLPSEFGRDEKMWK